MNDDLIIDDITDLSGKDHLKSKLKEVIAAVNELYRNPVTISSTDKGWPHIRKAPGWCYEIRNNGTYLVHCDTVHDKE